MKKPMPRYAENTSVSVERSKAEIETILSRYGATEFASGWSLDKAIIGFACHDRRVQFVLPLPDRKSSEFKRTRVHGRWRSDEQAHKSWEQACRQRWRALALCIKAKLEAVEAGITTFEDEFLAHIVLPNGQTIGNYVAPQLEQIYATGQVQKMLPMLESSDVINPPPPDGAGVARRWE